MPVERHSEIDLLADEWDDLANRTGATPFVRPGWIAAWWEAFGRGRLEVLAVRRAGRLAGVLPVALRFGTAQSPTNWHSPVFGPLAEDDHARDEVAQALFSQPLRRVSISWLAREDPAWHACRRAAARTGRRMRAVSIGRSPYVSVDGEFAEYEARLTSKRRSNLRRLRRRLEGEGELSVQVADGRAGLEDLLTEGLLVEASSWKGSTGTAITSRPETERFYRRVARWAAASGTLRLAFLRLDGRALAFDLALEDAGVHYLVKTGYEPSYRNYAPGVLLRHEMLARAFADGLRRYEFLGVEAEWKREWTDASHELVRVEAFATSLPGVVDAAVVRIGRPLAARAKARLPW